MTVREQGHKIKSKNKVSPQLHDVWKLEGQRALGRVITGNTYHGLSLNW